MDEAGSAQKPDFVNGRLVSCAGSRKRLKLQQGGHEHRDKAAQHLTLAWNAVCGRQPDLGKGYGDTTKAMEVATIPVVCPGQPSNQFRCVINNL